MWKCNKLCPFIYPFNLVSAIDLFSQYVCCCSTTNLLFLWVALAHSLAMLANRRGFSPLSAGDSWRAFDSVIHSIGDTTSLRDCETKQITEKKDITSGFSPTIRVELEWKERKWRITVHYVEVSIFYARALSWKLMIKSRIASSTLLSFNCTFVVRKPHISRWSKAWWNEQHLETDSNSISGLK